jgi:hypothetical protein
MTTRETLSATCEFTSFVNLRQNDDPYSSLKMTFDALVFSVFLCALCVDAFEA